MSKKVFTLVTTITGGIAAIASAIVAFFNPAYSSAIVASIDIVATAVTAVCTQFVKSEEK